jgi:protein disulfide-isomerase
MNKIIFVLFISLSTFVAQAQKELTWHTDMSKASELSMKEKKPLMLFFTGADWCGWCIRLQKEVFKTEEFTKWAKDNVILVELDFPRRTPQDEVIKRQNYNMKNTFQVKGYPTVWFVNPKIQEENKMNLEALGSTGYVAGGPQKWLESANSIIKK